MSAVSDEIIAGLLSEPATLADVRDPRRIEHRLAEIEAQAAEADAEQQKIKHDLLQAVGGASEPLEEAYMEAIGHAAALLQSIQYIVHQRGAAGYDTNHSQLVELMGGDAPKRVAKLPQRIVADPSIRKLFDALRSYGNSW